MAAWVIAGSQTQWSLVSINPTVVLGPGVKYHDKSESYNMMKSIGGGNLQFGAPEMPFGVVDVRDVAQAQVAAAFNPNASGRYLLCGHNTNLFDVGRVTGTMFPAYPVPRWRMPKWLLYLVAPFLPHGGLDRTYVWNSVGYRVNYDSSKSVRELGIKYRSMEETIADMFQQIIDEGVVSERK